MMAKGTLISKREIADSVKTPDQWRFENNFYLGPQTVRIVNGYRLRCFLSTDAGKYVVYIGFNEVSTSHDRHISEASRAKRSDAESAADRWLIAKLQDGTIKGFCNPAPPPEPLPFWYQNSEQGAESEEAFAE